MDVEISRVTPSSRVRKRERGKKREEGAGARKCSPVGGRSGKFMILSNFLLQIFDTSTVRGHLCMYVPIRVKKSSSVDDKTAVVSLVVFVPTATKSFLSLPRRRYIVLLRRRYCDFLRSAVIPLRRSYRYFSSLLAFLYFWQSDRQHSEKISECRLIIVLKYTKLV